MYSAANVEGLIEISSSMAARFGSSDDALLSAALADLDGSHPDDLNLAQRGSQCGTRFVAADFDQLQQELAATFGDLLKRLFEGE